MTDYTNSMESGKSESDKKKTKKPPPAGAGIAIGICLGAGVGLSLKNLVLGIGVGVMFGAAFETAFRCRRENTVTPNKGNVDRRPRSGLNQSPGVKWPRT